MLRFLGIGDNVADKYLNLNTMFPGGNAINFAAYSAKLGVSSAYLGVFGNDRVAAHILGVLDRLGVDTDRCRIVNGENGYVVINVVNGDRIFVEHNFGGVQKKHPIVLDDNDYEYIKGFDLVHTHTCIGTSLSVDNFMKIHTLGVDISYDFSNNWTEELIERVCSYIVFAFFSCEHLPDEEIERLMKRINCKGTAIVVCTKGKRGSMLYDGTKVYKQDAIIVEAVDTLGAGDSFITAFLCTFMRYKKGWKTVHGHEGVPFTAYDRVITKSLYDGAEFAAKTCMVNGAFGFGTEI